MLRLTFRLCMVSGEMLWSKMVRDKGTGFGRWEPMDERRRSFSNARLAGRTGTGENGRRELDCSCVSRSSTAFSCFCSLWFTLSLSKIVFSKARIWDVAAEISIACCCRMELSISSSRKRRASDVDGAFTVFCRCSISSSRLSSSVRRASISFWVRSRKSCSSS